VGSVVSTWTLGISVVELAQVNEQRWIGHRQMNCDENLAGEHRLRPPRMRPVLVYT
jgi:hypothetical protein